MFDTSTLPVPRALPEAGASRPGDRKTGPIGFPPTPEVNRAGCRVADGAAATCPASGQPRNGSGNPRGNPGQMSGDLRRHRLWLRQPNTAVGLGVGNRANPAKEGSFSAENCIGCMLVLIMVMVLAVVSSLRRGAGYAWFGSPSRRLCAGAGRGSLATVQVWARATREMSRASRGSARAQASSGSARAQHRPGCGRGSGRGFRAAWAAVGRGQSVQREKV